MNQDIDNEADEKAKQHKKNLLLRFKMQIEKPYWSDNIYLELNIENLTQCYIRAKKDIKDIYQFFSITEENKDEVLTEIGHKFKSDLRIQYEEKCYLTKLTFEEVDLYL